MLFRNGLLGVKMIDFSVFVRIEVIKGVMFVYGNGVLGGIINYIIK